MEDKKTTKEDISKPGKKKLKRRLGFFSVFSICAGAAFSSGFFLLPGMAADISGPSLPLAYLVAGILMLPAVFSIGELSAAMPRSGGSYFFITRSFGPLLGIIGVSGIYIMMLLKGAFAFVGVGAYLSLIVEVPLQAVALFLIFIFTIINLKSVKNTTQIEIVLVVLLLIILSYFTLSGVVEVYSRGINVSEGFQPLFPSGWEGFFTTVAFVFISFGGVGQVASLSEEINNPSRTIPRGMLSALGVATFFYIMGTALMVLLLSPDQLHGDQTPAATAAGQLTTLQLPVLAMVIAALAAFTSTGNAAILSASRYTLAMARDKLIWTRLGKLDKKGIPNISVLVSGVLCAALVLLFNVREIAKIASAFLLFVFFFMCLAVIVFRESKKSEYQPKFKSPLYPWVQIIGGFIYILLIWESGLEALAFIAAVILAGGLWYIFGIKEKPDLSAAIFYLFGRVAKKGIKGRYALGLNFPNTNLVHVIEQSIFTDYEEEKELEDVLEEAADILTERIGGESEELAKNLTQSIRHWKNPLKFNISIATVLIKGIEQPEMLIFRGKINKKSGNIKGLIVLVDDESSSDRMVQLLAQLEASLSHSAFPEAWENAENDKEIKNALKQDVQSLLIEIKDSGATADFVGTEIKDIDLPKHSLIAIIYRDGKTIVPDGDTEVKSGDEVLLIAQGETLQTLADKYSKNILE